MGDIDEELMRVIQSATLIVVLVCIHRHIGTRSSTPTIPHLVRLESRQRHMYMITRAGPDYCVAYIRMDVPALYKLVETMKARKWLEDSDRIKIEEQLYIFLHIVGHNRKNRVMRSEFQFSGETISRYFNLVLKAILRLPDEYMQQPEVIQLRENDGFVGSDMLLQFWKNDGFVGFDMLLQFRKNDGLLVLLMVLQLMGNDGFIGFDMLLQFRRNNGFVGFVDFDMLLQFKRNTIFVGFFGSVGFVDVASI